MKKNKIAAFGATAALTLALGMGLSGCGSDEQPESEGGAPAAQQSQTVENPTYKFGETAAVELDTTTLDITVKEFQLDESGMKFLVEYHNMGNETADFNAYDWGAQDSDGVIHDPVFEGAKDELTTGTLVGGGKVKGWIKFETEKVEKLQYNGISLLHSGIAVFEW